MNADVSIHISANISVHISVEQPSHTSIYDAQYMTISKTIIDDISEGYLAICDEIELLCINRFVVVKVVKIESQDKMGDEWLNHRMVC